ncbi:MAG: DUF6882 domain-containing protein [Thermoanaerobaculia bacterium]
MAENVVQDASAIDVVEIGAMEERVLITSDDRRWDGWSGRVSPCRVLAAPILCAGLVVMCFSTAQAQKTTTAAGAARRTSLEELLVLNGGIAAERQNQFVADLGDPPWHYEMDTGVLTFDEKRHYHAQVIGSYAAEDGTWMWAWANRQSNIPAAVLVAAERLRREGETRNIDSFKSPLFKIPREQVPALALAAAGVVDAKAFYLGANAGQIVVFLIDDKKVPALPEPEAVHVINTFNALILSFPIIDHRRAYEAYLRARGFSVEMHEKQLVAKRSKTGTIVAQFDAQGRLAKATTTVGPETR